MEPLHPILAGMGSVFSVKGLYIEILKIMA
jgi:hypothetical protein